MNRIEKNEAFIRNIFARGEMQGHGFCCRPSPTPLWEGPGDFTLSSRPVEEWVPGIVAHYERQVRFTEEVDTDLVPFARLCTGTHTFAAAFGSPVKVFENDNPCALPFITTGEEADKVEEPGLWDSPFINRIFELGQRLQAELGPDAYLGTPDMQTGFDTACLIWDKTELYIAMIDPEEAASVKRLAEKCARFFKTFLLELHRVFPGMSRCHYPDVWTPPEMGPWMSNDECGAISTPMFEAFLLPELINLAQTFGGIGMHCCADAEHQFASFKKIPNWYGFNRVAAAKGWRPLLEEFDGSDQTPVMVLATEDDEVVEMLIREAPEGMRFIFQRNMDDPAQAQRWIEWGRSLSPRR